MGLALVILSGCAVQKTPVCTGGSRADGTVDMAYEYGMFEVPEVNWQVAANTAQRRCMNWGYKNAESFGGGMSNCISYSSSGCNKWRVTNTFQCTGKN